MTYSCDCGKLTKELLNDVTKDLSCPICNTNLKGKNVSEQVKLEHYLEVKDSKESEIRRQQIFNYLSRYNLVDATDWEMTIGLGYSERNCVSPRRFDLVEMGLVKANCKRTCNIKNNKVTAWCLA